jgi:hypothetical protein
MRVRRQEIDAMTQRPRRRAVLALPRAVVATLGACTVYQVGPQEYSPYPPNTFERSWSAARGAFQDQGVEVVLEDRSTGTIRGRRGGIEVVASVRAQADGSVRVQFDASGATAQDPTLLQRVSRAYDVRMGR